MTPPTDGATKTADEATTGPAPAERTEGWDRTEADEAPRRRPGLPTLPRFSMGPRRPATEVPDPDPPRDTPPGQPGAPGPAGTAAPDAPPTTGTSSSPGSTDPHRRRRAGPDDEEWVDPRDLQAAVRQATDVAFVLIGQGFGTVERRARGLETVEAKWVPTKAERELVLGPAGRIAKRHIRADRMALDTIDGCMMAAGVGGFAMRGFFGVEPLGGSDETPLPSRNSDMSDMAARRG